MYDSPNQTEPEPTTEGPARLGNLVGGLTQKAPSSPLEIALSDHDLQLEKLVDLFNTLANRLTPVRNMIPQAETDAGQNSPACSPVVDHLLRKTEQVKYLQVRVTELLQELEV